MTPGGRSCGGALRPRRSLLFALVPAALSSVGCGSRTGLDGASDAGAPAPDVAVAANPCNPTTCNGCCNEAGACLAGTAQAACGVRGRRCQACDPDVDLCDPDPKYPDSQVCFVPCDPRYCGGCCLPVGTCVSGLVDTACGDRGYLCHDCTVDGRTCGDAGVHRGCVP